ncbi:MAG: PilZ domain-containing protein [Candidatus Omnitrophica bacterium]|nr:PilZ domain-containing protein [Candidatus Omnitrophota bacterium]
MTWSGLDQRNFPRIVAQCDVTIHDRIGGTLKTKTQNLGLGGVCVILTRELEKLSQVHLRITLEETQPPFESDGRVVWMVRSKEPLSKKVSYDTGIEFLNLNPQDHARISNFIKSSQTA